MAEAYAEEAYQEKPGWQILWAAAIFAAALGFSLLYTLIAHGTYDYDEFVYLLLGRAMTHGDVPYRDFLFYHPPGVLVTMALLGPLIRHWWVWGRVLSLILSAGTCSLVYLVARRFCRWPVAIGAGLLCAGSPIMLTTGTRIMPDIYVAFFTFLAVYILLVKPSTRWAVVAGAVFGVAVLFKYPALLILPACVLLAGKKRWPYFTGAMIATVGLLLIPLAPDWHQYLTDTIAFQSGRSHQPVQNRVLSILLFMGLMQPLAIFGAFLRPRRWWLLAGYLSALAYVASPQVYYHYMAPEIPFASILGALYLASLPRVNVKAIVPATASIALAVTVVWAAVIEYTPGQAPVHATAAQVSQVQPVERFVRAHTAPGSTILDDRPDVPFLSHRHNCDDYFWNDAEVMKTNQVQQCVIQLKYVVHTFGPSSGFPASTLDWMDRNWCAKRIGSPTNGAFIWNTRRPRSGTGPCPYLPLRG